MNTSSRQLAFPCCALLLLLTLSVGAQDAVTQARIDLESAKILLKQGKWKAAIDKFEEVRSVSGDRPELLVSIGQAEYDAKRFRDADSDIKKALSSNDAKFKNSPSYQQALQLAGQLNILMPQLDCIKEECEADPEEEHTNSRCTEYENKKEHLAKAIETCNEKVLSVGRDPAEVDCKGIAEDAYSVGVESARDECNKCKARCRRSN